MTSQHKDPIAFSPAIFSKWRYKAAPMPFRFAPLVTATWSMYRNEVVILA